MVTDTSKMAQIGLILRVPLRSILESAFHLCFGDIIDSFRSIYFFHFLILRKTFIYYILMQ